MKGLISMNEVAINMANEILSGSALTMIKAVKNCVEKCDISLEEALRMASLYPAKVLHLDNKTGKIETGFQSRSCIA